MRRKLVDVVTDEVPVGEDVRRWPNTAGSGSASPNTNILTSLIHLLQTEGAHVIFIGRRRPGNADGRPSCSTTHKDGARRAGRRQYVSHIFGQSLGNNVYLHLSLRNLIDICFCMVAC